jgi:signal transduction histidine kinase
MNRRLPLGLRTQPGLRAGSVRLRLTILYGALFLGSGAVLLAITYLLVRHATGSLVLFRGVGTAAARGDVTALFSRGKIPQQLFAQAQQFQQAASRQHASELHQLLLQSGIALAIMALGSVALGWLVAGRVLRPLRTMTAATRRISQHNLHERLALPGPQDELKELADTIDGLLARLEAAFEAQRRFVANASHELRTPLAMMRTSLDVATGKRGATTPQLSTLDAKLREGLGQAERLLESFLSLAQAENGAFPERSPVAIGPLLAAALETRQDVINEKQLAVEHDIDDAAVAGNETLLARMLGNLLDNAIRHNRQAGWIRIEARAAGDTAEIVIENSGAELDEQDVQQLVQPFRRLGAERTASPAGGVGLGLSIVAAIVRAHDGRMRLHARQGGGLQASIDLPLAAQGATSKTR